ncbi:MAG: hypothetical protein MOGDAGHF_01366 [Rhodocyclaceae bacterium]|nr:hypothetical protein [Rhodocyclaceae bacterium]
MAAVISRADSLSSTTSTRAAAGTPEVAPAAASGCTPKRAVKWNTDPRPGSLSTQMRPPISSTSALEIARPRPVPPYLRVVELSAWLKGWKSLAHCSGVMPMPLSLTRKCSSMSSAPPPARSTPITTSPRSVNLTALLARLTRTWPSRSGSPTSVAGRSGGTSKSSSSPLSSALMPTMLARLSITSSRRKPTFSMAILPASTLEKSRMPLRMPSRLTAERCAFST